MSLVETSPIRSEVIPSGLRNPVMLIPGLVEPDFFLTPAAHVLRRQGMVATTSKLGVITGRVPHDIHLAEEHLLSFSEQYGGEAVTLVGHSLGGLYARILALRHPDMVKGVVTVGSPSHHNPIESIRSFKLAGHVMMDLLGKLLHEYVDELREPIDVPEHHIYTPFDLIVNHTANCEDKSHTHHGVLAPNHFTLMLNPLVHRTLRKILPSS